MGLREKVALMLVVIATIQITTSNCLPSASRKDAVDRYLEARGIQTNKVPPASTSNIKRNTSLKKSMLKSFNFPETEYPTASTSRDYYNTGKKIKTQFGSIAKDDSQLKAVEELKKDMRMKRKLDRIQDHHQTPGMSNIILNSGPELITNKGFPEVQYPLNVLDTWEPSYWNTPTINQNEFQYEQPDFPMFSQRVSDKNNKSPPNKKQSKSIVKQFMEDIDTLNEKMYKSKTNNVKGTPDLKHKAFSSTISKAGFEENNKTDSNHDPESVQNSTLHLSVHEQFKNNSANKDLQEEHIISDHTNDPPTEIPQMNSTFDDVIPILLSNIAGRNNDDYTAPVLGTSNGEGIHSTTAHNVSNEESLSIHLTIGSDVKTIVFNETNADRNNTFQTESMYHNGIKTMPTDDPLNVVVPLPVINDDETSKSEEQLYNTNMKPHTTFIVVPVQDYENMMEMPIFHRNTSSSVIVFMPSKTKNVTAVETGNTDTSSKPIEINSHSDEDNKTSTTSYTECSEIHQNESLCHTQPDNIISKLTHDILLPESYPLNGTTNNIDDTTGEIINDSLLSSESELNTSQPTSTELLNPICNESSLMDNNSQLKMPQEGFIQNDTVLNVSVIDAPFTHLSNSDPLLPAIHPITQLDAIMPENNENVNIVEVQPSTPELSAEEIEYETPARNEDKMNSPSLQIPRQVDIDYSLNDFGVVDNDTLNKLPLFKETTISENTIPNMERHDQDSETAEDNYEELETSKASHDELPFVDRIPLTADAANSTTEYIGSTKPSDDIKDTSSTFKSAQQNQGWSATLDIPVSNYKEFRDTLKDAVHFSIINKMPPLEEPEYTEKLPSYSVLLHYDRHQPAPSDSQLLISDKINSNDNNPTIPYDSKLEQDIDSQLEPIGGPINTTTESYTKNVQNDPEPIENENFPISNLSLENSLVLDISSTEADVEDVGRFLFTSKQYENSDMDNELKSEVRDETLNTMEESDVAGDNAITPLESNEKILQLNEPINDDDSGELIALPFNADNSEPVTGGDKRLSARNTFTEPPWSETYTEKVLPVTVIVNSRPEDKISAETLLADDSSDTENVSEIHNEYSDEISVDKLLYEDDAPAYTEDDEEPLKINILPPFLQRSNGNKMNNGKKNRLLVSIDKDISRITPSYLTNYLYTNVKS